MKFGFTTALTVTVLLLAGLMFLLNSNGTVAPDSSSGSPDAQPPLVLYCAAGIRLPVTDTIAEYEQKYGVTFQTKFAGSGALLSDLRAGGGDLYLAADVSYLQDARRRNLVREIIPLAHQSPVIAVHKGNPKNIRGLEDLKRDDVELSLAQPKVAAISRVARRLLEAEGQWEGVWDRADIQRATVNEVANDIKLQAADAGIVWDATAEQYPELEIVQVPQMQGSPNQITIGILESSTQPTRALHFARYLSARDKGLTHFAKHGYRVVHGDKWSDRPEITIFSGGLNFPAIERTIQEFERREGVTVLTTAAGCGVLVAQMKGGARPDLYFSCDVSFMDNVKDLFVDAANVSRTDMVIITPKGNPHGIAKLEDLTQDGLKLALCDPQKSALGKLTADLLQKHRVLEQVRANQQVTGPTAAETLMYVVNGRLDAAIVYKANTSLQRDKLDVIPIDDPAAIAIQPIAVARGSKYPLLTARLKEQIMSAKSKPTFEELGFEWLVE